MTPTNLLQARLEELAATVTATDAIADPTSRGFAARIGGGSIHSPSDLIAAALAEASYGGIPDVAFAGFLMSAAGSVNHELAQSFLRAVSHLRGRPVSALNRLTEDDIAVLGVAAGLASSTVAPTASEEHRLWLAHIADSHSNAPAWTRRARVLAAELVDPRGRLRAQVRIDEVDAFALDVCLREAWPSAYTDSPHPPRENQQALLAHILTDPAPREGELERATVWQKAATLLVRAASLDLVPNVDRVADFLKRTQGALKRWVWEPEAGRRKNTSPACWLIDSEAHVQAFLWAMLYPAFGDQLKDEQYLPGFGQKQPRYDFGIVNLKLIIEVKVLRTRLDYKKVEEEIAGDSGLYFSDPARFDRMVVYIYDDCDAYLPELHDALRSAILQRDPRITDVVIVRRPSMMPDRAKRGSAPSSVPAATDE